MQITFEPAAFHNGKPIHPEFFGSADAASTYAEAFLASDMNPGFTGFALFATPGIYSELFEIAFTVEAA